MRIDKSGKSRVLQLSSEVKDERIKSMFFPSFLTNQVKAASDLLHLQRKKVTSDTQPSASVSISLQQLTFQQLLLQGYEEKDSTWISCDTQLASPGLILSALADR